MNRNSKKTMAVDGVYYENYLTPEARDNVQEIISEAQMRSIQGDVESQEILSEVQTIANQREEQVVAEEKSYQRTLQKKEQEEKRAGFINASIILYFVLLFGVLIASALIFFQK